MTLRGNTKIFALMVVVLVLTGAMVINSFPRDVYAAQLTARKLTLSSSASNAATTWTFEFSDPGTPTLKGISFQVCTTATGTCNNPNAWSNGTVSYTSLTYNGTSQSGWALDGATAPCNGAQYFCIKNNAAATATTDPIVATFNVTNPTTTNETFYVRIITYTGNDFTTSLDDGVVAASTATAIVLTGYMPESLVFCTGETISLPGGLPDCSTATAGSISLPDFSPTAVSSATSDMAASTNAATGYSITVFGPTLTSGGNTITAIGGTAEGSQPGKIGGQFGLNLKLNTDPVDGAEVNPATNGTNYKGQAKSPFATVDDFAFTASTTQEVAASDSGGAGPTDAQRFTVTYIVNVSGAQPVGTYTSTLTYVCTPTF